MSLTCLARLGRGVAVVRVIPSSGRYALPGPLRAFRRVLRVAGFFTVESPTMKVVRLIPEAGLLVIFDRLTKETTFTLLPDSQIRRLADDFEEARLLLDPPSPFQIIEPDPSPA